jgi:hypothetical protein
LLTHFVQQSVNRADMMTTSTRKELEMTSTTVNTRSIRNFLIAAGFDKADFDASKVRGQDGAIDVWSTIIGGRVLSDNPDDMAKRAAHAQSMAAVLAAQGFKVRLDGSAMVVTA